MKPASFPGIHKHSILKYF